MTPGRDGGDQVGGPVTIASDIELCDQVSGADVEIRSGIRPHHGVDLIVFFGSGRSEVIRCYRGVTWRDFLGGSGFVLRKRPVRWEDLIELKRVIMAGN